VTVLSYTVQRLLILFAVAGVLILAGARGLLLWVLAFLISGVISLVVLRRQRDAISARLASRKDASQQTDGPIEDDELHG
jgi:TctA family transporter